MCVSGESEGFTGARIGYPRVKKNILPECIAHWLVQTNKPKDNHAMQLILQFGWLAGNPKKLSEALGAKVVIILPRFGSSMSFWYASYLDIHVQ